MKYCIGCKHWYVQVHRSGQVYSDVTMDSDTPAELSCQKGHWAIELDIETHNDASAQWSMERCMSLAETCKDYSERSPPGDEDPRDERQAREDEYINVEYNCPKCHAMYAVRLWRAVPPDSISCTCGSGAPRDLP